MRFSGCGILEGTPYAGRKFGQIGKIINAYVKKLTEGPPIKSNNSDGILKFAKDLYNCELTCGSRPESGLDLQLVIGKVFARLSRFLHKKFITSVSFQLEKGHAINVPSKNLLSVRGTKGRVSSGGYSNLGAREKNFQKSMYRKKESFDLVVHFFLPKSRCFLKKKGL